MADPLLTTAQAMRCPHGGTARAHGSDHPVRVRGAGIVAQTDPSIVIGCDAHDADGPCPCVGIRWVTAATRVRMAGLAPLLATGIGLAIRSDGVSAGPITIADGPISVKMI